MHDPKNRLCLSQSQQGLWNYTLSLNTSNPFGSQTYQRLSIRDQDDLSAKLTTHLNIPTRLLISPIIPTEPHNSTVMHKIKDNFTFPLTSHY
jgi:hypothetical protein